MWLLWWDRRSSLFFDKLYVLPRVLKERRVMAIFYNAPIETPDPRGKLITSGSLLGGKGKFIHGEEDK